MRECENGRKREVQSPKTEVGRKINQKGKGKDKGEEEETLNSEPTLL